MIAGCKRNHPTFSIAQAPIALGERWGTRKIKRNSLVMTAIRSRKRGAPKEHRQNACAAKRAKNPRATHKPRERALGYKLMRAQRLGILLVRGVWRFGEGERGGALRVTNL